MELLMERVGRVTEYSKGSRGEVGFKRFLIWSIGLGDRGYRVVGSMLLMCSCPFWPPHARIPSLGISPWSSHVSEARHTSLSGSWR